MIKKKLQLTGKRSFLRIWAFLGCQLYISPCYWLQPSAEEYCNENYELQRKTLYECFKKPMKCGKTRLVNGMRKRQQSVQVGAY